MATYPNTESTLDGAGGKNKTSTSTSTNIIIKVNGQPVGAVQALVVNESREIKPIDELGTDGHIDSMPVKSTNVDGTCNRIRFDRLRIAPAFSRGFIHVKSQVYPFDIDIVDTQLGGNVLTTTIKNVWIKSISYTYSADNWIITDQMGWTAEDIYTINSNGGSVVEAGNERGLVADIITGADVDGKTVETVADTGGRRGSFDISNIIGISSGSN